MTPFRGARGLAPVLAVALGAMVFACSDESQPTTPLTTPTHPGNGATTTPTQIAITTQPSSTVLSGSTLAQQPVTQLRDASNNPVSQSGVVVTAAIVSGVGTLGGTKTATTNASGVATFSNLSIAGAAGSVALGFSAPSMASATANATTVSLASSGGSSGSGSGSGSTPLMAVNWGSYANTAALAADCTHFDCSNDHFGNNDVTIDPSTPSPNGSPSLRYHYNHGAGTGCTTITLGRDLRLPSSQVEAWAEFQVKWSTNFTTGGQVPAHSCDPNDHKLIFGLPESPSGSAGRWAFYVGSDSDPHHNLNQERPYPLAGGTYLNGTSVPSSESLWQSGTWHTIRLHIKNSTTASSGDGVWEIWVDGSLKHRQTGFNVSDADGKTALKLRGFSLGRNKDDGPPNTDMFLWWGPVAIFAGNPGW